MKHTMMDNNPARRPIRVTLTTAISLALAGLYTMPALADNAASRVSTSPTEVESSLNTEHGDIRVVQLVSITTALPMRTMPPAQHWLEPA